MTIEVTPEWREALYKKDNDVVLRDLAGEQLLIPIRNSVAQMHAIFALTGIGVEIWKLLDGARTLGEVQAAIVARFEVSEETAWTDLRRFVAELEEGGLVRRV
ncbi:MAG: PqqD family protein [Vicinamibacteria bacterium]|jgi:hypothetical protein|nr:PqqD family protein [Vicinamibacteria bacterium]